MNFTVIGVSYKETPIETRELLSIDEQDYRSLLKRIYHRFQIKEVVILSTCNRLEIYGDCSNQCQKYAPNHPLLEVK